jgi:hypothetical protein
MSKSAVKSKKQPKISPAIYNFILYNFFILIGFAIVFAQDPTPPPDNDKAPIDVPGSRVVPPPKIPEYVTVKVGKLAVITAECRGLVQWWVDEELVKHSGQVFIDTTTKKIALSCPVPGKFVILAWTAEDGFASAASRCYLIFSNNAPDDSEPVPPKPVPPKPNPEPNSEEYKALKAAYELDLQAKTVNKQIILKMIEVYRKGQILANDMTNKTVGDVYAMMRKEMSLMIGDDKALNLRKEIAKILSKTLPVQANIPLDATLRNKFVTEFAKIENLLNALWQNVPEATN